MQPGCPRKNYPIFMINSKDINDIDGVIFFADTVYIYFLKRKKYCLLSFLDRFSKVNISKN